MSGIVRALRDFRLLETVPSISTARTFVSDHYTYRVRSRNGFVYTRALPGYEE